jgi:hypothetical protein
MPSSGMLRSVAPVGPEVSDERILFIIRVTRISGLGTKLAVTINQSNLLRLIVIADVLSSLILCHPDDGDDTFLRNVGFCKSHMA